MFYMYLTRYNINYDITDIANSSERNFKLNDVMDE